MTGMDENPYESPLTVDEPRSFRQTVPWRELVVWVPYWVLLAAAAVSTDTRQATERAIAWIILIAWLLLGTGLARFMRHKTRG